MTFVSDHQVWIILITKAGNKPRGTRAGAQLLWVQAEWGAGMRQARACIWAWVFRLQMMLGTTNDSGDYINNAGDFDELETTDDVGDYR